MMCHWQRKFPRNLSSGKSAVVLFLFIFGACCRSKPSPRQSPVSRACLCWPAAPMPDMLVSHCKVLSLKTGAESWAVPSAGFAILLVIFARLLCCHMPAIQRGLWCLRGFGAEAWGWVRDWKVPWQGRNIQSSFKPVYAGKKVWL